MVMRLRLTVLTTLLLLFDMSSRSAHSDGRSADIDEGAAGGSCWDLANMAIDALEQYALPFGQFCIAFLYGIYRRFSLVNTTVLFVKYIPTRLYMYKMLKDFYTISRERLRQKEMEFEDIQLQVNIINTKLSVCKNSERSVQLRRGAEAFRAVRARVRRCIDADEALRRALGAAAPALDEPDYHVHATPEQEREYIIALFKVLESADPVVVPDRLSDQMESEEHNPGEEENSVYSSLSDGDLKQDCRLNIVQITNVYEVSLKKQRKKDKTLRRATQQYSRKKKNESIKKALEGWQKWLSFVINTRIPMDTTTQEAMGDYLKPNLRESSDSDSDLLKATDPFNEEYCFSAQNTYKNGYYDDMAEPAANKEFYDTAEYRNDLKYLAVRERNERNERLYIVPEEDTSQIAIEEIKSDAAGAEFEDSGHSLDIVAI